MNANMAVSRIAVTYIKKYLGENLSVLYEKFYQDKAQEIILKSLQELFLEYVGSVQADKIMNDVTKEIAAL
jgi:ribosomal protein S24E